VFDNQDRRIDTLRLKCVVLGAERTRPPGDLEKYYCLLIAPCESGDCYNRVGAAFFVRYYTWFEGAAEGVCVT
jgi:hypothetical protein